MKPHLQIALFTKHDNDPLSGAIAALTRSQYCHAAFVTDAATNSIYEQFAPHCRFRKLGNDELEHIDIFSISGWTDHQDVLARSLIAQCNADQVPYWVNGLMKFLPNVRALEGEATADDWAIHAFCSMEVFEVVRRQGCELLRAQCFEVHPGLLSMSPLLVPEPQLSAVY